MRIHIFLPILFLLNTININANDISQHRLHKPNHKFSFALIGDVPYNDEQEIKFDKLIKQVNTDRSIKFVMHAGDIKSGGAFCDDETIIKRFAQYQSFKKAFIYTPGDNEWTDCHRVSNGQYNPLERLEFLRKIFFPDPNRSTGKRPIRLLSQSHFFGFEDYVENVIFSKFGVLFATLHVVGSNNNLAPWSGIDPDDSFENPREDRLNEFRNREQANLHWLDLTFDIAKKKRRKGVFIMIQANPRFELGEDDESKAGFNSFISKLRERTIDFGRPVVLAHGDFHFFLIDKPLDPEDFSTTESELIPNFTRIQTFGSPDVHWIKVNVDPKSSVVFTFEQKIVR